MLYSRAPDGRIFASHYRAGVGGCRSRGWDKRSHKSPGMPRTLIIEIPTTGWQRPANSTSLPPCRPRLSRCTEPNWAAVIKAGEQLQAIDPAAADPDGLMTSARAELAAQQRAAALAADYHNGLRLFDAGRWDEAIAAFERVTRLDSTYQDVAAAADPAELEKAAATLVEKPPSRPNEKRAETAPAGRPRSRPGGRPRPKSRPSGKPWSKTAPANRRKPKTTPANRRKPKRTARQQKEAADRARQLGSRRAGPPCRGAAEEARRLRKEQRRRDTHQLLRSPRQRAARLLSRRWVVVLAVSVGIGGALLLLIHVVRTPPIMGQLPADLRASCTATGTSSATCLCPTAPSSSTTCSTRTQ